MAKDWIKKAIKHPGRCTPGSPNYDCPKGSPQWNLAQRFKHGDLHKKEEGGKVEKLSPEELKWIATSIRGDKSAEYFDGYFPDNTIEGGNVLRIKKLNDDQLEQVKNYMKNTSFFTDVVQALTPNISIFNKKPKNSKLEQGGYAASDNIDMGYYTNPVKYFAAKGANIPTSWDNYRTKLNSKEESKFLKWRSTLPENLQNENDYDLRGYYKEYGNKPIPKGIEPHLTDEFKLPNHPTFSENSRYYNDETNYLGGKWDNGLYQWKYTPNSEFKNEVIEKKNFDELRNDFILNNHNILSRNPNIFKKYGGYIDNDCLECGGKMTAFQISPCQKEN